MAPPKLQLLRSAVPGRIPSTSQLFLGGLALNTNDGKLFLRQGTGVAGDNILTVNPWNQSTGGASYNISFSAGNVGINTTNPVTPLHISDGNTSVSTALYTSDYLTISAQNTAPGFNIICASTSAGQRGVFKATRSRGTLSTPTAASSGDSVFSLLGAAYDGATAQATAQIAMEVDGAVSAGVAPQRITFWTGTTTGASRVERLRISSGGNVGIGTPNPQDKLEINSLNGADVSVRLSTNNDTFNNYSIIKSVRIADTQSQLEFYVSNNGLKPVFVADSFSNVDLGGQDSKVIITGGTKDDDNTSVPYSILNVCSNSAIAANTGGSISLRGLYTTTFPTQTKPFAVIKGYKENGINGDQKSYLALFTNDGTDTVSSIKEALRINSSQNVGIGTTGPTEKLDVNGKIKTNDSVLVSDSQIKTTTTTRTASSAQFTADTFSASAYRSTKYIVEVRETATSNFYTSELLLMHDGSEVYLTEYGSLKTSVSPVSFIDADINSGNVRLLITPSVGNTITKISRISLTA